MPQWQKAKKLIYLATFLVLLVFGLSKANAAFNPQINYQGKLLNSSSQQVDDDKYNFKFRLCTDSDCASPIWTETHCYGDTCDGTGTDNRVNVTSSLFSVLLGDLANLNSVDFNQTLYLELQVGGTSTASVAWETLLPRKKLGAVPAAFEALRLDGHTWEAPGALGGTTASSAIFTNATATLMLRVVGNSYFGAVASGTWQGAAISNIYGGTGQNSSAWTGLVRVAGGVWSTSTVSLTTDINGTLSVTNGGTGTSTAPSLGQLLIGNTVGGYNFITTSSLGLLATDLGGFTAGSIVFASSTGILTQDNSNFFWDDANNRLGIGTTTPQVGLHLGVANSSHSLTASNDAMISGKLEVNGEARFDGNVFIDGEDILYFAEGSVGTIKGQADDGMHLGVHQNYNKLLVFTDSLNILKDHDHDTIQANPTMFFHSSTNPDTDNTQYGSFAYNTTTFQGFYTQVGSGGMLWGSSTTNWMVLDSSGNLGIGTTAPNTNLEIYKTNSSSLRLSGILSSSDWTVGQSIGALEFYNNDGSGGGAGVRGSIQAVTEATAGNLWSLTFGTSFNNGAAVERMRINSNGLVGIGTTTPSYKLTVAGDMSVTGTLRVGNSADAGTSGYILRSNGTSAAPTWIATSSLGIIATDVGGFTPGSVIFAGSTGKLAQDNAKLFWDDTNDRLGIGTTSPMFNLDLKGGTIRGTLSRVSARNYFGDNQFYASELHNTLYKGESRFAVSSTGFASCSHASLFDGNYESACRVASSTTAIVEIDLIAKGEYTVNGVVYPQGYVYLTFYHTYDTNLVSGRAMDRDGVWRNLTSPINVNAGADGYSIWRLTVPANTYLTKFEFTIESPADEMLGTWLTQIEYHQTRPGQNPIANFDKYSAQSLYDTLTFKNSSNSTTISLATTGDVVIGKNSTYNTESASALRIEDAGFATVGGLMGADTSAGAFYIQSMDPGTSYATVPLLLNPNGGKVGIGTTSPSYLLDIQGATSYMRLKATTGANSAYADFVNTGGTVRIGSENSAGGNLVTGSLSYAGILATTGAYPIQFGTSNGVRMTVASGGNVGIGTTTPTFKLTVTGDLSVTGTFRVGDSADPGTGGFVLMSNGSSLAPTWVNTSSLGLSGEGTPSGWTDDGATVRLTTIGDSVGIGTTTPGGKLGIYSTDGNHIQLTGANLDGGIWTSGNLLGMGSWNDASKRMFFDMSTGNVGIGTTSPVYKLQVHKAFTASGLYEGPDFGLSTDNGSDFWSLGSVTGYVAAGAGNSVGNYPGGLLFKTKNADNSPTSTPTTKMVINSAGNVGIGTTAPKEKLSIMGSYTTSVDTLGSDLGFGEATNGSIWGFRVGADPYNLYLNKEYGAVGANVMTWDRVNGNVGIGTTTPFSKFEVNGGTTGYPVVPGAGAQTNGISRFSIFAQDIMLDMGTANASPWGFWLQAHNLSNSSAFPILLNPVGGNVAIGTTTPVEKLDVYGNGIFGNATSLPRNSYLGTIIGTNQGNTQTNLVLWQQGVALAQIGSKANDTNFYITNDNYGTGLGTASTSITLANTGNVGIGTTAPGAKLEIYNNYIPAHPSLKFHYNDSTDYSMTVSPYIVGSGNVGYKFQTQNASGSFVDALAITGAGKVGIGTVEPAGKLDIVATQQGEFYGTDMNLPVVNLLIRSAASTSKALGIGSSLVFTAPANSDGSNEWGMARILGTPDGAVNGDANGALYLQTRSQYDPGVGGTWNWRTGLVIRASGNVGIGITAPSSRLSIYQPAGVYGASNSYLSMSYGTSGELFKEYLDGGWNHTLQSFAGEGTGHIILLPAGNVGIGTTTPSFKLTVSGDLSVTGTLRVGNGADPGTAGYILMSNGASAAPTWVASSSLSSAGGWTDDGAVVRLTTVGDEVGIGIAAPLNTLHVNKLNDDLVNILLTHGGSDVVGSTAGIGFQSQGPNVARAAIWHERVGSYDVGDLKFAIASDASWNQVNTSTDVKMTIKSSGNVGIGTADPGALLTLGNIALSGGTAANEIRFGREATTVLRLGQAAASSLFLAWSYNATPASAYASLGTYGGSNPLVLQESGGNVGIGTTAPLRLLQVGDGIPSSVDTTNLRIAALNGSVVANTAGKAIYTYMPEGGTYGTIEAYNYASSTELPLVINPNGGKVGIGTTDPGATLDIAYTYAAGNTVPFKVNDQSGYGIYVNYQNTLNFNYGQNADTAGYINYVGYAGGATQFRDLVIGNGRNGTLAAFDGSTGNVGIGTTTPGVKLDVSGALRADTGTFSSGAGLGKIFISNADGLGTWTTPTGLTSGVQIGTANLMRNSGRFTDVNGWTTNGSTYSVDSVVTYGGYNTLKVEGSGGIMNTTVMRLKANTTYTISALVKGSASLAGGQDVHLHVQSWTDEDEGNVHQETGVSYDQDITTSWKTIYQTFTTPASASSTYCRVYIYPLTAGYTANFAYIKLEQGNIYSDWTIPIDETVAVASISGTTNYIPKFTGTNTIGNSLIFDNGTNVSIGNAAPQSKLHVGGTTSTEFSIGNTDYGGSTGQAIASLQVDQSSGNGGELIFKTLHWGSSPYAPTEKMRLDENGYLGIGTATPQARLQVYNSGAVAGVQETIRSQGKFNGATGDGSLIRFTNQHATGDNPNAGEYNLGGVGAYDYDGNWGGALAFYTAPAGDNGGANLAQRMTIIANGNVGIGVTEPGAQLHITQQLRIDGSDGSGYRSIGFGGNTLDTNPVIYSNLSYLAIDAKEGSDLYLNGDNATGDTIIQGGGGNVGIGDVTPDYLLDVSGTSGFDSTMTFTGSAANIALGSNFLSGDGGDEGVFVDSDGEVGIGTGTPGSLLHLFKQDTVYNAPTTMLTLTKKGNVTGSITDGMGARINFQSEDKDGNVFDVAYIDSSAVDPNYDAEGRGGDLVFSTLNNWNGANYPTERMRIKYNGNIGISTTTPAYKLTVAGDMAVTGTIRVGNSADPGTAGYILKSNGSSAAPTWVSTSSFNLAVGAGSPGYVAYWNGTNSLTYDSGDFYWDATYRKLGIGTSTPRETLDVAGKIAINGTPFIFVPNQTTYGGTMYVGPDSAGGGGSSLSAGAVGNVYVGRGAGWSNTSGDSNTGIGQGVMGSNTTGQFNTAVGLDSLQFNTIGNGNTALGEDSLNSNVNGGRNTSIGLSTLRITTSSSGNVAVGFGALYSDFASSNTAVGFEALTYNSTGALNVALGYQALRTNATSFANTAMGYRALYANTVSSNTAVGFEALYSNTTGAENTANGYMALRANTDGGYNVALGYSALSSNSSGDYSTAIGWKALGSNTTGLYNTAVGAQALFTNATGNDNVALGTAALYANVSGVGNTALGSGALLSNTASSNTAVGYFTLFNNITGEGNVAIGSQAMYDATATPSTTAIGYRALANILSNDDGKGGILGEGNTAVGYESQYTSVDGENNTSLGYQSLYSNIIGINNIALGFQALYNNNGDSNVAIGATALLANTTGRHNLAIGVEALRDNTEGEYNLAIGTGALILNTTGMRNIGFGVNSGYTNTTGNDNIALGYTALQHNASSGGNVAIGSVALHPATSASGTAVGYYALSANTTGVGNTALGYKAGDAITNQGYNTAIGAETEISAATDSATALGYQATVTADDSTAIGFGTIASTTGSIYLGSAADGDVYAVGMAAASDAYYVCRNNSTGRITTRSTACGSSDTRLKINQKNISSELDVLGAVKQMDGIYFNWDLTHPYNTGRSTKREIGVIAQDMYMILPEVVEISEDDGYYSVDYPKLTAFLIEVAKAQQNIIEPLATALNVVTSTRTLTIGSSTEPYTLNLTGDINFISTSSSEQYGHKLSFSTSTTFESSVNNSLGNTNAFIFNALNFNTSTQNNYILSLRSNNSPVFSVSSNGDVITTGNIYASSMVLGTSTNPGDLAERVDINPNESVEAGDVMMVDPNYPDQYQKTNMAYEPTVAGVISTNPTIIVGNGKTNQTAPLAMVGRVPVKITTINGLIKRGDLLVASNIPGTAMKYDPANDDSSKIVGIIGIALDNAGDSNTGKVMALIRTGWVYNKTEAMVELQNQIGSMNDEGGELLIPEGGEDLTVSDNNGTISYSGVGHLNLSGNALINVSYISSPNNAWAINEYGLLIAKVTTSEGDKNIYGMGSESAEITISGTGTLQMGEIIITFNTSTQEIIDESQPIRVNVTLTSLEALSGIAVIEKSAQGFKVKELNNGISSSTFDWIVIAKRKMLDLEVEIPPLETAPAETTPTETTPTETVPVETTPIETTPTETAPVDTTPIDITPVDTTPTETAPAETIPPETAPIETPPTETVPDETTPTEAVPTP